MHDTNVLPHPLGIVPDRDGQELSSSLYPHVSDRSTITAASQPVATPAGLEMVGKEKQGRRRKKKKKEGGEERREKEKEGGEERREKEKEGEERREKEKEGGEERREN